MSKKYCIKPINNKKQLVKQKTDEFKYEGEIQNSDVKEIENETEGGNDDGGLNNDDDDDNDDDDGTGSSPGGDVDEREELERRLNRLRGNDSISLRDFEYQRFYNQRIKQRQKEITGLKKGAKGNVRRKRLRIEPDLKFKLPILHLPLLMMITGMMLRTDGIQVLAVHL